MKYSANIGFLWDELALPARILAAQASGYDAVEFHFPYDHPAEDIRSTLDQTDLSVVGINTRLGPEGGGDFGVAALPGREAEAREFIDQAIEYAVIIGAGNVNVVAGLNKEPKTSEATYIDNLNYACKRAAAENIRIVIEPLSPRAVPGYHFCTVEHAVKIIDAVDCNNLKLMLDVYHTQIVQGDIETLVKTYSSYLGHVQISAIHDRGEPDAGEIYYPHVLKVLQESGYTGYIGAEYRPRGNSVEEGMGWLSHFRKL